MSQVDYELSGGLAIISLSTDRTGALNPGTYADLEKAVLRSSRDGARAVVRAVAARLGAGAPAAPFAHYARHRALNLARARFAFKQHIARGAAPAVTTIAARPRNATLAVLPARSFVARLAADLHRPSLF